MPRVYIPAECPGDWKQFLAEPEKQWKPGFSAYAVAHSWQNSEGLPREVRQALNSSDIPRLHDLEVLLILPEHKVALPGGSRASQNDVWVLARNNLGLVSIAVEGKVSEPFGPTIDEWDPSASRGRHKRLDFLCTTLGLSEPVPMSIRYQLLHRTASAILEAQRFHASTAVMLVHSFSQSEEWFSDFAQFTKLLGASVKLNGVSYAIPDPDVSSALPGVGSGGREVPASLERRYLNRRCSRRALRRSIFSRCATPRSKERISPRLLL
jgi:hypothetical protein